MQSSSSFGRSINLREAIAAILFVSSTAMLMSMTANAQEAKAKDSKAEDVTHLSDVNVVDDPLRALNNEPSASAFGFAKPLLETPRTVTFVSEEQLSKFGIQSVQDLTRLVPGTYTTTRYGLQGAINIRTVTADQYYRGMKRLDQQGHVRTVLSAYDYGYRVYALKEAMTGFYQEMSEEMLKNVYPFWSYVVGNDEWMKMVEPARAH